MKFANIFFVIIFFLSAILQLNDSDALLWFSVYSSGAVLCLLPLFKNRQKALIWLALASMQFMPPIYLLVPMAFLAGTGIKTQKILLNP